MCVPRAREQDLCLCTRHACVCPCARGINPTTSSYDGRMQQPSDDQQPSDADLQEQLILTQALFSIAHESEEAEIVRLAMSALVNTQAGLDYLHVHSFNV